MVVEPSTIWKRVRSNSPSGSSPMNQRAPHGYWRSRRASMMSSRSWERAPSATMTRWWEPISRPERSTR